MQSTAYGQGGILGLLSSELQSGLGHDSRPPIQASECWLPFHWPVALMLMRDWKALRYQGDECGISTYTGQNNTNINSYRACFIDRFPGSLQRKTVAVTHTVHAGEIKVHRGEGLAQNTQQVSKQNPDALTRSPVLCPLDHAPLDLCFLL